MRIANLAGRLSIVVDELAVDVAEASDDRFGPEVQAVYERFDEFREWAASAALPAGRGFRPAELGAPAPQPRQLFAIGLNYSEHANESGFAAPPSPAVFTNSSRRLPDRTATWPSPKAMSTGRSSWSPSSAGEHFTFESSTPGRM